MIYAKKNCLDCNKKFTDYSFNQVKKFCDYYCKKNYTLARRRKNRIKNIEKQCAYCNKTFIQKFIKEVKYCSNKCNQIVQWKRLDAKRKIKRKIDPAYYEHERQLQKQWRKNNKERVKEFTKKAQSKESYKIKRKAWYKVYMSNPDNHNKRKEWERKWRSQDHVKAKKKLYKLNNREHIRKRMKEYTQRPEVKNRVRERIRYRLKNDPIFRLKSSIRTRIYLYVKRGLAKKTLPTSVLIGCSWEFLKIHLEKQFKPHMSWTNYGKWHIDHQKPMASFNLFKQKELLKCCNFSNLQPLWASENLSKGAKLIDIE
jgi:hypothetical protein